MKFFLRTILVGILTLATTGCGTSSLSIASNYDGDTFTPNSGPSIRLLQIDTPELDGNECYAFEAKEELERLLKPYIIAGVKSDVGLKELTPSSLVRIESDSLLNSVDSFDRDLRYLWIGDLNVNVWLVEKGFATPFFYKGQKGKYANDLLRAVEKAEKQKMGIWGNCSNFKLNVYSPIETGASISSSSQETGSEKLVVTTGGSDCSQDYRECVPNFPPDLNCGQLVELGLIHVIGNDPHRLDRDGDGLACESNAP